ncbi:MAG: preprotein translocase subunit SecG [Gammaproteobacteria bacterium]|nr:preprotein translocase subunit SecG [Gammaproteobacteria bacterium]MBK81225.1 preprotein translocase subunit SecG [Gammaproteobacteria bacterium]|tara:strand:+ start:450 stop:866 length:417 start_codon:yes stop_codon:yes gene_type:complete
MDLATLETVLLVLLVADAIALGGLVLMQHGKGADVGAAFGSGGANTVFGSAGSASFLTKLTVWLAIGFFLISFGLAYTASHRAEAMDQLGIPQVDAPAPASETAPAAAADGVEEMSSDVPSGELTPQSERVDSDIPEG